MMRGLSNGQGMPWMVGMSLLQTVLLVGIVTKVAMVAVRWEHDHVGHAVTMRNEFEVLDSVTDPATDGGGSAHAAAEEGAATSSGQMQRGHPRHWWGRLNRGGRPGGAGGAQGNGHGWAEDPRVFHEEASGWPYICWTPIGGMSSPSLTMVTVIDGLPKEYQKAIWDNRMHFAARHGYRYCELQMHDRNKIPAFTKLPWILALAPCTDFVIHLDADAQLSNMTNNFKPWIQFMNAKGVDQLFSADIIRQSPINYGVFMIRTAPWIWNFYKKIYNLCACDWSRMHDWPAEQGIVYDLIAGQLDSFETGRSMIVSNKGWNHILDSPGQMPEPHDVLVHLTYPRVFPDGDPCYNDTYRDKNERACKYLGLTYFLKTVIGTDQHNTTLNVTTHFVQEQEACQQVRQNSLLVAKTTYSNQNDALPGSVMDFDLDPHSGQVVGVKVSEIACLGYREKQCSLNRYWDVDKGQGPWELNRQEII